MRMLVLITALFFSISHAEILFTDDFNDGNDDGWTHIGAASYEVTDGEYFIYNQGDRGQGKSTNGDTSGTMSTSDYSVLCSIVIECGSEGGLFVRYGGSDQWYYRMVMKPYSSRILLERKKDSGPTMILDQYNIGIYFDVRYWIRLQADGDSICARIWQGSAADEPDVWHLEAEDSIQQEAGCFGVFAGGYGKISWSSVFDDVVVSTPLEQHLSQVTWASIKAAGD